MSKNQYQSNSSDRSPLKNQSEFQPITGNLLKAREKSRIQGVIGFASHWLKNWGTIFNPVN